EDLAPSFEQPAENHVRHGDEWQRERIDLLRLGDLLGARRAEQAVWRPRAVEVGLLRDLGIAELVLVGRRDVDGAGGAGRLDDERHRRLCLLGALEVEPAAWL